MSAADSGFVNRNYSMTAISGVDELTVDKTRGSEWTTIEMTVNGDKNLVIVRSRSHLAMLRTMIGEALGIEE